MSHNLSRLSSNNRPSHRNLDNSNSSIQSTQFENNSVTPIFQKRGRFQSASQTTQNSITKLKLFTNGYQNGLAAS